MIRSVSTRSMPPLRETVQSFFAAAAGQHAIATGFQHDFADGKRLFVIVDAQNRSFGLHSCFRNGVSANRTPRESENFH